MTICNKRQECRNFYLTGSHQYEVFYISGADSKFNVSAVFPVGKGCAYLFFNFITVCKYPIHHINTLILFFLISLYQVWYFKIHFLSWIILSRIKYSSGFPLFASFWQLLLYLCISNSSIENINKKKIDVIQHALHIFSSKSLTTVFRVLIDLHFIRPQFCTTHILFKSFVSISVM